MPLFPSPEVAKFQASIDDEIKIFNLIDNLQECINKELCASPEGAFIDYQPDYCPRWAIVSVVLDKIEVELINAGWNPKLGWDEDFCGFVGWVYPHKAKKPPSTWKKIWDFFFKCGCDDPKNHIQDTGPK